MLSLIPFLAVVFSSSSGPAINLTVGTFNPTFPYAAVSNPVITCDVADGATVSGTSTLVARVQSDDIVTQVEFYVDGELVDTQRSTPYKFTIETAKRPDGPLKLKLIAYTDAGGKAVKEITVTVNNGKAGGIAPHIKAGNDKVSQGDFDGAIQEGTIALAIDKHSSEARFLLARAYMGKKDYSRAEGYIEDVTSDDPTNLEAYNLQSVINLKQAYDIFAKQDQTDDTVKLIQTALESAVGARQSYEGGILKNVGAVTDANRMAYADAANNAGAYTLTISALSDLWQKDQTNTAVTDRLAYAQAMSGRIKDGILTAETYAKFAGSKATAYAIGLSGGLYSTGGNSKAAEKAVAAALQIDATDLQSTLIQASNYIDAEQYDTAKNIVASLIQSHGELSQVWYMQERIANALGDFAAARSAFQTALLAEPLNVGAYIEQADASVRYVIKTQKIDPKIKTQSLASAEMLLGIALKAKGDSFQALTELAIVKLLQGKNGEALTYAKAATEAQPEYAAGFYTYAAALQANGNTIDAGKANRMAGVLDQINLSGAVLPDAVEAWHYFTDHGKPEPFVQPYSK